MGEEVEKRESSDVGVEIVVFFEHLPYDLQMLS